MEEVTQLTPYQMLGGEAPLRHLVDRFYDIMDTDPRVLPLRQMHGPDLTPIRQKLFEFLSGWLGGPSLFIEKYGHPMLRARHMPFAVDEDARDQWLLCMYTAMDEVPMEQALRDHLEDAFFRTADFMRNR
ncbi:hemoglobin [Silvimonas terrae]|uniref:Hemoglobin n=1 Tax=Silvimonas terrae TaxID=300266 RepID=A0A840RBS0_9NEIS|nr:group II truncated hemoglobin [Silvimonas terrae]MBB5190377.1 hemoglobin [Silvimonas terrae]